MAIREIFEKFTTPNMVKIINELKPAPKYVTNTFFKKEKASLTEKIDLHIKKSSGLVLTSVTNNGEHFITDSKDEHLITVTLPRFPLKSVLSASEINQLNTLQTLDGQTTTLAKMIGEVQADHRNSFDTTLEFMAIGALFGKILDGSGKVLFEFATKDEPIKFNDATDILSSISDVEMAISDELGTSVAYTIFVSSSMFSKLLAKANRDDLFKTGLATLNNGTESTRVLMIAGTNFVPYSATYKNQKGQVKKFLEGDTGIAVPTSADIFELYYTRANHTEALGMTPTKYFSAKPEELDDGKGYSIISECRAMPVCVQPTAIKKVTWAN